MSDRPDNSTPSATPGASEPRPPAAAAPVEGLVVEPLESAVIPGPVAAPAPTAGTQAAKLLLSGLGTGYLPRMPGTWGSAGAVAVWALAVWVLGPQWGVDAVLVAVAAAFSVACVAGGRLAEQAWGRKDPGQVTADEWAGQAITLIALPTDLPGGWLVAGIAAFLAFRFYDILKPPPARMLERLPRGWGVLLDDLAAGVMANVTCQILLRLVWVMLAAWMFPPSG